jgi:hypothetical protein
VQRSTMSDFSVEVKSGDRLRALVALRDTLTDTLDRHGLEGSEISSLSLRLQRVLAEIHELGGTRDEETDGLAERRRSKLSATAGP